MHVYTVHANQCARQSRTQKHQYESNVLRRKTFAGAKGDSGVTSRYWQIFRRYLNHFKAVRIACPRYCGHHKIAGCQQIFGGDLSPGRLVRMSNNYSLASQVPPCEQSRNPRLLFGADPTFISMYVDPWDIVVQVAEPPDASERLQII